MLLTFEGGKVKISPMAMSLSALKKVWTSDRSPGKENAIKHFGYIYFMTTTDNLYGHLPREEYHEKVLRELDLPQYWKPTEAIQKAIEVYSDAIQGISAALLRKSESSLRFASDTIDRLVREIEKKSDDDKNVKNLEVILSTTEKLMKITMLIPENVKKLEAMRQEIRKEAASKSARFRGDYEPGDYELVG
jgi:hypothetical protein